MNARMKQACLTYHNKKGVLDGVELAFTLTPRELLDLADWPTVNDFQENGKFTNDAVNDYSPLHLSINQTARKFFVDAFESSDDYALEAHKDADSGEEFWIPNEAFRAYQDGVMASIGDIAKKLSAYL